MPSTEAQKRASKNWRDKNRTKYNESQLKHSIKYWENNKPSILAQKKDYWVTNSFKRERNRLFRILLKE
jgi:hypothetical protein